MGSLPPMRQPNAKEARTMEYGAPYEFEEHYVDDMVGEELECWTCTPVGWDGKPTMRKVVALGAVVGTDPTQTYKLECGHVAI